MEKFSSNRYDLDKGWDFSDKIWDKRTVDTDWGSLKCDLPNESQEILF